MPNDLLSTVDAIVLIGALVLFLLAFYQSFIVRRIMTSQVYRNRALWTGVVSIAAIPFNLYLLFIDLGLLGPRLTPFSVPNNFFFFIDSLVGALVTFRWMDSTIGVSRELDFYHADRLSWSRYRKLAWLILAIGVLLIPVTTAPAAANPFLYVLVITPIGLPFVYAGLTLVKSAPHVYDVTMRKYFRWMGLFVVAMVAEITVFTITNIPLLLNAYFYFRAARSLSARSPLEPAQKGGEAK